MKIVFIILLILNGLFGIINIFLHTEKPLLKRCLNFNIIVFLFMIVTLLTLNF